MIKLFVTSIVLLFTYSEIVEQNYSCVLYSSTRRKKNILPRLNEKKHSTSWFFRRLSVTKGWQKNRQNLWTTYVYTLNSFHIPLHGTQIMKILTFVAATMHYPRVALAASKVNRNIASNVSKARAAFSVQFFWRILSKQTFCRCCTPFDQFFVFCPRSILVVLFAWRVRGNAFFSVTGIAKYSFSPSRV